MRFGGTNTFFLVEELEVVSRVLTYLPITFKIHEWFVLVEVVKRKFYKENKIIRSNGKQSEYHLKLKVPRILDSSNDSINMVVTLFRMEILFCLEEEATFQTRTLT